MGNLFDSEKKGKSTNFDQILLILSSRPNRSDDVETENHHHRAENGGILVQLLELLEHRFEIDRVRWNVEIAAERGQMCAKAFGRFQRRQRSDLKAKEIAA